MLDPRPPRSHPYASDGVPTPENRSLHLYLITTGRRSGRPQRIEIWFAAHHGEVYLLSGGRDRSDWVQNLQANGRVTVELAGEHHGAARVLQPGTAEDWLARELLVAKYEPIEQDSLEANQAPGPRWLGGRCSLGRRAAISRGAGNNQAPALLQ